MRSTLNGLVGIAFLVMAFLILADVIHPNLQAIGFLACIVYSRVLLKDAVEAKS